MYFCLKIFFVSTFSVLSKGLISSVETVIEGNKDVVESVITSVLLPDTPIKTYSGYVKNFVPPQDLSPVTVEIE